MNLRLLLSPPSPSPPHTFLPALTLVPPLMPPFCFFARENKSAAEFYEGRISAEQKLSNMLGQHRRSLFEFSPTPPERLTAVLQKRKV